MKTIFNNNQSPPNLFKTHNSITRFTSICLVIAVLNLSVSCSYFTVRDVETSEEMIMQQVNDFNSSRKYVIIHFDNDSWHLENMVLNDDEQIITGSIQPLTEAHLYKKSRSSKRVHRYSHKKQDPLDELHFFLKTDPNFKTGDRVTIPLDDIEKISYNDKNTGRTVVNILAGTLGVVFVGILLYVALKSSCPFVYIKNGESYVFAGELYPGIITPNLQENDYLELQSFEPKNGYYTLKVSNQLKEIQYTDLLELLTIKHPKHVEVLLDSKGNIQTFQKVESPINIKSENVTDVLDFALEKDYNSYMFNASKTTEESTRSIVFEFTKPEEIQNAKLYLTAKNSMWLDYVFGKFNQQFGDKYNEFQNQQQSVKKDQLKKWTNGQHIPLSVFVKTEIGWQLVDRISTVGPLAMRDIVVPLDLSIIDQEILEVKLETGFMFWEVDYVGIDFSENIDVSVSEIKPDSAIDKNGKDVTGLLSTADETYFVQPEIGDEMTVKFKSDVSIDTLSSTTVYLKNRGYYNYIRTYSGSPNIEKLKTFREDHTFTKFSEESYFNFINYSLKNLAQNE
ncbi:hypothetical protein [Winogradskyella sp.]|uniref:hypothetical protein n=1 Tax=Winogradskyella sp. TaxID=1883156 RepID=UPI003BAB0B17